MAFSYYKSVTIDHTKVPNTDQSNFPVLVSFTSTDLKSVSNSGHVQSSSGYDIYFYSDSALTTRIPAERERYVASTGEVIFWVKVSSVSHTSDTVFYLAYGDSGISSDPNSDGTYGATSVWDSNYKGVYHLPDGSSLTANDSTSNGKNGTLNNTPTAATGKIGGAASFGGAQSITADNFTSDLAGPTAYTMSCWFKPTSTSSGSNGTIVGFRNDDVDDAFYLLQLGASSDVEARFRNSAGTAVTISAWSLLSAGTWVYLCFVYDGTNLIVYSNGNNSYSSTGSGTFGATSNRPFWIGNGSFNTFLDGVVDEARFSISNRSADWIKTEYNNQNSPSTFHTIGTETAVGGGAYNPGFFALM